MYKHTFDLNLWTSVSFLLFLEELLEEFETEAFHMS